MSHLPPLDRLTLTPTGEFYPLSRREVKELNRRLGSEVLTKEGFRRDTEPWHTFRVKLKQPDGTFKDHFYHGESLWEWYQKSAGGARPPTDPMTRQPVWYEDWWALHDKFDPEGAVPAWAHSLQKLAVVRAGGDLPRMTHTFDDPNGRFEETPPQNLDARAAEWLAGEQERQLLRPARQNATHWPEELAPPPLPAPAAAPAAAPALRQPGPWEITREQSEMLLLRAKQQLRYAGPPGIDARAAKIMRLNRRLNRFWDTARDPDTSIGHLNRIVNEDSILRIDEEEGLIDLLSTWMHENDRRDLNEVDELPQEFLEAQAAMERLRHERFNLIQLSQAAARS